MMYESFGFTDKEPDLQLFQLLILTSCFLAVRIFTTEGEIKLIIVSKNITKINIPET